MTTVPQDVMHTMVCKWGNEHSYCADHKGIPSSKVIGWSTRCVSFSVWMKRCPTRFFVRASTICMEGSIDCTQHQLQGLQNQLTLFPSAATQSLFIGVRRALGFSAASPCAACIASPPRRNQSK
mmetsp:Transcript_10217/g.22780  ORF Transcript_10217/g.22780 Transcript_10217/m.22780 type:complete len:124 (-) Transcript_10217:1229-1600(-)